MSVPLFAGSVRVREATGAGAEALLREAKLLQRARHPGVEELLEAGSDGPHGARVVTTWVVGLAMSEATTTIDEVVGVMTVLATTVADLHEIGVAHGALDAAHVVVGPNGRPVLVGFDRSCGLGGPARRWPSSDEALADVAGLGRMLTQLLNGVGAAAAGPRRRRRIPSRSSRGGAGRWVDGKSGPDDLAGPLRGLAARAASGAGGLTARALTDALLTADPDACLPRTPDSLAVSGRSASDPDAEQAGAAGRADDPIEEDPLLAGARRRATPIAALRSRWTRSTTGSSRTPMVARLNARFTDCPSPRAAKVAGAALFLGLAVAAWNPWGRHRDGPPQPQASPVATLRAGDHGDAGGPASYAGGVLTVGASHFAVGAPGDAFVIGRWWCHEPATAALLRPATGQVWVFPAWPDASAPVVAQPVTQINGAAGARAHPVGPCDALLIRRNDGSVITVRPWATRH